MLSEPQPVQYRPPSISASEMDRLVPSHLKYRKEAFHSQSELGTFLFAAE